MRRFLMMCAALLAGGSTGLAYTNVLENGASQTITNGWDALGDMVVGDISSNNVLTISGGGSLTNVNGYLSKQATAQNNSATVTGAGSLWHNTGSLNIGGDGSNSILRVEDSATVFVGQDFQLQNQSWLILASTGSVEVAGNMAIADSTVSGEGTIRFSPGANELSISGTNTTIDAGIVFDAAGGDDSVNVTDWTFTVSQNTTNQFRNFENLTITDGVLTGSGTLDAFGSTTVSGGRIAPTGDLVIENNFNVSDNITLQLSAGASSLRVTDPTGLDISGMAAEIYVDKDQNPEGFTTTILTADGGFSGRFASTNLVEHFLLYDFALTNENATTFSVTSEAAASGDFGAELAYGGIQGIRAGFNGMVNAAFVRTRQLRRNSVATDHAISNEDYLLSSTNAPAGPQGPGDKNTVFGMHFWIDHFSGQGDYDAMGKTAGFSLDNNGTSFGFDRIFGDSLMVGVNYTYARSAASTTANDHVDTETYWLGLYGEWYKPSGYYLDGLLALGWSNYDTVRTQTGYEGIGKYRGSDLGGHLEGGKYFHTRHWALAPYVGMQYLSVKSDAYTEHESTGGHGIDISSQSIASLESALGIKLRNRFDTRAGRFQTIGYAEWAYDFINDDIGYSLSQGALSVETARIAPGASLVNTGVGLAWICTDYLEIGIGYDGRFNENYEEHVGSLMLDVRF